MNLDKFKCIINWLENAVNLRHWGKTFSCARERVKGMGVRKPKKGNHSTYWSIWSV